MPLTNEQRTTPRELRKDDTVVIAPADKGRMMVVLDHDDCNSTAMHFLNDTPAYVPATEEEFKSTCTRLTSAFHY